MCNGLNFVSGGPYRRRHAAVAGQQLYTDGSPHQADTEHRGDHRGGSVAAECIRDFERTPEDSCREAVIWRCPCGIEQTTLGVREYKNNAKSLAIAILEIPVLYGDAVMSLIDDIGNAFSSVVGAVGNAVTTTVNAVVNTVKSTVDTIAGLFHRLFR